MRNQQATSSWYYRATSFKMRCSSTICPEKGRTPPILCWLLQTKYYDTQRIIYYTTHEWMHQLIGGIKRLYDTRRLKRLLESANSREGQQKASVVCNPDTYQYVLMNLGLTNAPATYQRALDMILNKFKWKNCTVYIDNIFYSKNFDEHIHHVDKVLITLANSGVTLKINIQTQSRIPWTHNQTRKTSSWRSPQSFA